MNTNAQNTASLEFAPVVDTSKAELVKSPLKIIRKGLMITKMDGQSTECELAIGEITRGTYQGRTVKQGSSGDMISHAVREDDGSLVLLNSTKALETGFSLVSLGEPVMVTYGGKIRTKSGKSFYNFVVNTAKNFNE